MLPRDIGQKWHDINDFWDSNLWDIEPHCQVVGLGGNDTIILSGAFGAPINWGNLKPVNPLMRNTLQRQIARILLRSAPIWFFIGALLIGLGQFKEGTKRIQHSRIRCSKGFTFWSMASPLLIYSLYVGKTWAAQPWLFGFEGYMEIEKIERLVFGVDIGRLQWSPYSSDLSLHEAQDNECLGLDPTKKTSTAELVSKARDSSNGELKVFTLIDTNTLTVTLFRATRPPVAMILCGSEGGMQRALLCSYDWKSQTLYRESVLRVDTRVLEKMPRVDRFRLGLEVLKTKTAAAGSTG